MNFKELVSTVSNETGVPAADVRKVRASILSKFAELIDHQSSFVSSFVTIKGVTLPGREETHDRPGRPERKIARMKIRVKNS